MIDTLISITFVFAAIYFPAMFAAHCINSVRRRKSIVAPEVPAPIVELPTAIEPMTFGEGVQLSVTVPTKIRPLKKFVRDYGLQEAVKDYAKRPYSLLNLAQLSEAVEVAIAA